MGDHKRGSGKRERERGVGGEGGRERERESEGENIPVIITKHKEELSFLSDQQFDTAG